MVLKIGIVKQDNQEFISTGAHSMFSRSALQEVTVLYMDEWLVMTNVRGFMMMNFFFF